MSFKIFPFLYFKETTCAEMTAETHNTDMPKGNILRANIDKV